MNLSTVRKAIKQLLSEVLRIDQWDPDEPRTLYAPGSTPELPLTANTATEYPTQKLTYTQVGESTVVGSALLPYTLTYRLSSQYALGELPLTEMEALTESVQVYALLNLPGEGGIKSITLSGEEYPVRIERDGTDQADWLITIRVEFSVTFAVTDIELPAGFGGAAVPPTTWDNSISCGIYRSLHPVSPDVDGTYVLDQEITIEA